MNYKIINRKLFFLAILWGLLFSFNQDNFLYSGCFYPSLKTWIAELSQGYSILHLAAMDGNESMVKFLLDMEVDPNQRNRWGETALQSLMAEKDYSDQLEMITLLLQAGTDPNSSNTAGITPVHIAAGGNSEQIMKLLIDFGGNLNSADSQGNTSVHFASANPDEEMIQLVVENSGDLNICNLSGESPLHWAVGNGNFFHVQILIDHGADLDIQDFSGNTPLHWAVFSENPDMVNLLISNNCDWRIKNNQHLTAGDIAEKYLNYSKNFSLIRQILISADQN